MSTCEFTLAHQNYIDEVYNDVLEIYTKLGLKAGSPMTATNSALSAGSIALNLSGDGINTTTVERIA